MTKRKTSRAAPWSREKSSRRVLTRVESWADSYITTLVGACHPKQRAAAEDPALRVSLLCPGRAGKTTAAEVRLLTTMLRKPRARCLFIAVTKEQASDISWEKFKDIFDKLGVEATFHEARKTIRIVRNGSTLFLRGADDKKEIGKLRGIPFDGVVIDEAASHPAKLLDDLIDRVLAARMGERSGWIMMIGTPGHILAGPFYDATRPGGPTHRPYADRDLPKWKGVDREWSSHHWTLEYAAQFVPAAKRSWEAALALKKLKGWLDTNPVWMREFLGLWAADDTDMMFKYRPHDAEGAPLNQWVPDTVGPMKVAKLPADLGDDWLWVLIFDKGFTDNFAVNAFAFSPTDVRRRIFHVYGFEAPGMYVRRLACLLLGSREDDPELPRDADDPQGLIGALGWPAAAVGDVDQGFLDELRNVYGVAAAKADKNAASKATTIEEVNGDLAERRIFVLKDSELEQQLGTLQWVEDEFGAVKENKNQANHSADCLVYARRVISPLFEVGEAPPPPPPKKTAPGARPRGPAEPAPPPAEDWSDLLASSTYEDSPW